LLVISGLSIYAVSEENDNDPERDDTVPKGVKKIYDMGVFGTTATTSVLAYAWMFKCLQDENVSVAEAWITFGFFFVFIAAAFAADRYKAYQKSKQVLNDGEEPEENVIMQADWTALEMYRDLVKDKQGEKATSKEEKERREQMKSYLKDTMKTD